MPPASDWEPAASNRARLSCYMAPPGCGKSLGAKRLAWNTGLPLLKVRFDALISSYFGESAANLRAVFVAARERPCVLLLDECDLGVTTAFHLPSDGACTGFSML